jgi:hypothetical protein
MNRSARGTLATLSTLCACLGAALLVGTALTYSTTQFILGLLAVAFLASAGASLAGLLVLRGLDRP